LGIQLLFRDGVFGKGGFKPIEVDVCLVKRRPVTIELSLELEQLSLEWSGIDLGEDLILADRIAFTVVHTQ